jgi:hypothetical protein
MVRSGSCGGSGATCSANSACCSGYCGSTGKCFGPQLTLPNPLVTPDQDAFYTPPTGWNTTAPGTVLQYRSVDMNWVVLFSTSYQLLVRSTDRLGNPTAVTATVIIPAGYTSANPIISYQPATDSLGTTCMPAYQFNTHGQGETNLMQVATNNNWALVVTDYEGPEAAWEAGRSNGNYVLDGIRGALQLQRLAGGVSTKVGLWGYSGGGTATAWAATLKGSYAPELNVKGVAFGGTAGDIRDAQYHDGTSLSGAEFAAMFGLTRSYTNTWPDWNAAGMTMYGQMGSLCGTAIATDSRFANKYVQNYTTENPIFGAPDVVAVEEDNKLAKTGMAITAPVFQYHSVVDEVVPYCSAVNLRNRLCGLGTSVDFVAAATGEHAILMVTGASTAVNWLANQFAGYGTGNNCSTYYSGGGSAAPCSAASM